MSRLIVVALAVLPAVAHADDATPPAPPPPADTLGQRADAELGDQAIGAMVGLAIGGPVTPGGFRIGGHYLIRLDEGWWFDGGAVVTFGSGAAGCFRDRMNTYVCDHRFADGEGFELVAVVRRMFATQGQFRPFAYGGIGIGIARYNGDNVTGLALPLHGGGGVRAEIRESIAIVGQLDIAAGLDVLDRGLGAKALFGFAILAGTEFKL
jgi:hypothetical protein